MRKVVKIRNKVKSKREREKLMNSGEKATDCWRQNRQKERERERGNKKL